MAKPGEINAESAAGYAAEEKHERAGQGEKSAADAQQKLVEAAGLGEARNTDALRSSFDASADPGLSAEQIKTLDNWRNNERQIIAFNAKNDKDGGAETQNGVYKLTVEELKKQGLDKKGWEALPVAMGSALDKIGADIVLVNRQSGDIIFLDPTSRRLDPRTGETLSHAESAKTNVPALRADGVVDALPGWFDKMSGNLAFDHDKPMMQSRIKTFAEDFRFQLADLTSRPSSFNIKDFPLPSPLPSQPGEQGQAAETAQIKAVVDWSNAKAEMLRASGESGNADNHREFGKIVGQALNFTVRTESAKFEEALHRNASKVIVEDAISRAYPHLYPPNTRDSKPTLNFEGGARIMINKQGQLIAEVPESSQAAGKYVITGGNANDVFREETTKLITVRGNQARMEQFIQSLPSSVQKRIEKGEIKPMAILAKIEENRAAYSAGGYGQERPLLGRVVEKLGNGKTAGLRSLVEDVVPNDKVETKAKPAEVKPVEVVKPIEAEKPIIVKEEFLKQAEKPANKVEVPTSRWGKPAPTLDAVAPAYAANDHGGEKSFVPLSAAEVQKIREERVALEKKGQLTQEENHRVRALKFAEKELTKPGPESWKADLVSHVRKAMRSEARGSALGVAIISSAVLSWYGGHQNPNDPARASFGETW